VAALIEFDAMEGDGVTVLHVDQSRCYGWSKYFFDALRHGGAGLPCPNYKDAARGRLELMGCPVTADLAGVGRFESGVEDG
jgi:hypothetical protein